MEAVKVLAVKMAIGKSCEKTLAIFIIKAFFQSSFSPTWTGFLCQLNALQGKVAVY
jgi:hypothetical protein